MQTQTINTPLSQNIHLRALGRLALTGAIVLPGLALAEVGVGAESMTATTCNFLNSAQTVLNAISVAVVTIAIIFAGYQIAFAHKRISEVAPVLVGAILIGAAGQIAKMFLPNDKCSASQTNNLLTDTLNHLASAAHTLSAYI